MKLKLPKFLEERKFSFILILAVVVCVCYVIMTWFNLGSEIKKRRETYAELCAEYDSQVEQNDKLERELKSGISEAEKEYIARNELGYILPGEHVYADAS